MLPLLRAALVSMMQPYRVTGRIRLIFIATITLLAVQTLFISRYGEPYPALVMPAFYGSASYQNGRIRIAQQEAVLVADGEQFTFPLRVLLNEIPDSHHGDMEFLIFRSRSPAAPVAPAGRWEALKYALFPGYVTRDTSGGLPENLESLRNWLRRRGQALLPGRHLSRLEIRRSVATVRLNETGMETEREPIDKFVVEWDEERK